MLRAHEAMDKVVKIHTIYEITYVYNTATMKQLHRQDDFITVHLHV